MIRLSQLSLCLSILLLTSCSQKENQLEDPNYVQNPTYGIWQDAEIPPFEFELIDEVTIELGEDQVIGNVSDMKTDSEGNFYVIDNSTSKLLSFTRDGELRFVTGQEGRGPGDIRRANSMIILRDTLLISNQSGTRIDYYDLNGNFLSSKDLPVYISFGRILGEVEPGVLMINRFWQQEVGTQVVAVDMRADEPDSLYSIKFRQAGEVELPEGMSAGAEVLMSGDKLYPGNYVPYRIRETDLRGNVLRTIERDYDRIVLPGFHEGERGAMIMGFGSLQVDRVMKDGTIITSARHPTEELDPNEYARKRMNNNAPDYTVTRIRDFFDASGRLLYSMEYGPDQEEDFLDFDHSEGDLFYDLDYSGEKPLLRIYRLNRNTPPEN